MLMKRDDKKRKKLAALGIDYKFDGYAGTGAGKELLAASKERKKRKGNKKYAIRKQKENKH